jgi:hypothetical protein
VLIDRFVANNWNHVLAQARAQVKDEDTAREIAINVFRTAATEIARGALPAHARPWLISLTADEIRRYLLEIDGEAAGAQSDQSRVGALARWLNSHVARTCADLLGGAIVLLVFLLVEWLVVSAISLTAAGGAPNTSYLVDPHTVAVVVDTASHITVGAMFILHCLGVAIEFIRFYWRMWYGAGIVGRRN